MHVFARDGYDGASLARIAADAGTQHPLILYYFRSKEGLWREIVTRIFSSFEIGYGSVEALTRDLDSLSALKMFCRAFTRFSARYPDHIALVLNEVRGETERLDWIVENIRPLHQMFNRLASQAIEDGLIKPVPPAHMINLLIGAASTFFASRPLVQRVYGIDPLDEEAVMAHTEWVIETLFSGLTTRLPSS